MIRDDVDVSDFLTWYPELQTPEFAKFVVSSREFAEFRVPQMETPVVTQGELLVHQKLIGRFLSPNTPYPGLLLFVKVGGGKTCAAVTVSEQFKDVLVNGLPRNHPLILVKNESLMKSFVDQIHGVCTVGLYGTAEVGEWREKGMSKTDIDKRLAKRVHKAYDMDTYGTFSNSLAKMKDDEIIRLYSNRVIICDEVHVTREHDKQDQYYQLSRLLSLVVNCRVLLMTGTPIWESPSEFSSIMNLLLPADRRLPSGKKFTATYFQEGKLVREQELIDAWRGKISYLRASTSNVERIIEGQNKPWFEHIKVVPSQMSEYQATIARRAEQEEQIVKGKTKDKKVKGGSVLRTARDAMNFVYPEQKGVNPFGKQGFEAFVKKKKGRRKALRGRDKTAESVKYVLTDEYRKDLSTIDGLRKYSCKSATIITELLNHPEENAFIYSEFVVQGGAILLSLVLELYGYTRVQDGIPIGPGTRKAKRYAIFTSNPSTTSPAQSTGAVQTARIMEMFNNPLNKHGEYLQVIIGSEVISQGYTLKNVRQTHVFMPHWNQPSEEQAFGRTLRYGSHDALKPSERYVKFYSHAAVYEDPEEESIDISVYKAVERKESRNAQLYRLAKIISFDCALSYKRNVTPNDIAGTKECDYQECNYECLDLPPTSRDAPDGVWRYDYPITNSANYNLLYYYDDLGAVLDDIRLIYKKQRVTTLDDLVKKLTPRHAGLNLHSLINALDVIINAQVTIKDYLGFDCVLKEQNGYYFLDEYEDQTTSQNGYQLATYTYNPIVLSTESFAGVVEYVGLQNTSFDESILCRYARNPSFELLYQLPYAQKVLLIEQAYIHLHDRSEEPLPEAYKILLGELRASIYQLPDGPAVHIMYMDEYLGASFNTMVKKYEAKGQLRVFVPSPDLPNVSSFWMNETNEARELHYIEEIKKLRESKRDTLLENKYGVYGTITQDKKFRIRTSEIRKGKTKGKECGSYGPDLFKIIRSLEFWPEINEDYVGLSEEELKALIRSGRKYSKFSGMIDLDHLSREDLVGCASYSNSKMTIQHLCFALRTRLAELGLLFDADGAQIGESQIRAIILSQPNPKKPRGKAKKVK